MPEFSYFEAYVSENKQTDAGSMTPKVVGVIVPASVCLLSETHASK